MNGPLPPLHGHAPPLECNRWLGADHCHEAASWHVMWTSAGDNGLCCDEHAQEARKRWAFYAMHAYAMECSMPGAMFAVELNRCVVDEGWLGLESVAAAGPAEAPKPEERA